jgi:hypothetical protein
MSARLVLTGVVAFLLGAVTMDVLYQWLEERKR